MARELGVSRDASLEEVLLALDEDAQYETLAAGLPEFIGTVVTSAFWFTLAGLAVGAVWSFALDISARPALIVGAVVGVPLGAFLSMPAAVAQTRERRREMPFVFWSILW
ncbi:MAG TPA: hypothetical protein QGF05_04435, partial [Dehalococcoidia bacterium]|nr:hypothetical protein [Dehalococcoidia bacterium]